jgi:hypothetical protein
MPLKIGLHPDNLFIEFFGFGCSGFYHFVFPVPMFRQYFDSPYNPFIFQPIDGDPDAHRCKLPSI